MSDLARPVPYRARPIRPVGYYDTGLTWPQWLVDDQREASGRPDVVTLVSDVPPQPLKISGEPVANLVASTTGTGKATQRLYHAPGQASFVEHHDRRNRAAGRGQVRQLRTGTVRGKPLFDQIAAVALLRQRRGDAHVEAGMMAERAGAREKPV